jgi:hypothetical protein
MSFSTVSALEKRCILVGHGKSNRIGDRPVRADP